MGKLKERRKEIFGYTEAEAKKELNGLRRELYDLRMQRVRGELKNTQRGAQVRADIARLLHHLSLQEKEQG